MTIDKEMALTIDHTLLKPDAKPEDIIKLCAEAKEFGFFSVCVNPVHLSLAISEVKGSSVKSCTVVGFPLGQNTCESKIREAEEAIKLGADEVDMVISVGHLKAGEYDYVLKEIQDIKKVCEDKLLKVIVETALLSESEIETVTGIVKESGAEYIKTSTGFSTRGASLTDIEIFKRVAGNSLGIKASGGIKTRKFALELIEKGATRIGASSSIQLVTKESDQ